MNKITNKVKLLREEKIFNTLHFIEAAEQHGILVGLLLVNEELSSKTDLGTEKFVYHETPIMQYVIHHDTSGRPKQQMLKYANIIKEKYKDSGHVMEIPMYYLYDKQENKEAIDVRLTGDDIKNLVKTEDSVGYQLKYLPIRRGTIIFLPQEFFTPELPIGLDDVATHNLYQITEVYIDIDAVSYECIVVPYKTSISEHNLEVDLSAGTVKVKDADTVEKDAEGNVVNFLNFDSDKHGM